MTATSKEAIGLTGPPKMRITLCARAKILQIIKTGGVFRIQATGSPSSGSQIDLISDAELRPGDSTISHVPRVVVDIQTATLLANQNIDFDYSSGEFIISNREKE